MMKFTAWTAGILLSALSFSGMAAEDFSLGIDRPFVQKNALRERQCLNGLWRFNPVTAEEKLTDTPPADGSGWGYFKVPAPWPSGYSKTGSFVPLLPEKKHRTAAQWHSAWYRRNFTVPASDAGKQVILEIELLQTRGMVFVDGAKAGEILFPGGELNLTKWIRPGKLQTLEIRLSAIPLKEDHYIVMDGNNIRKVVSKVQNKGITGDVFLHIVPSARIDNTHFITSVKNGTITFDSAFSGLKPGGRYTVSAEIFDRAGKSVRTFSSTPFSTEQLRSGRFSFTAPWKDAALWDIHTPQNLYTGVLTLSADGKKLDSTIPERFGFREIRIEGQNYVLNGKVLHLRAYHLPNFSAFWMPDKASKESSLLGYRRLRDLGFNFTISRNYNFAEGNVNYLRGSFEAADEFGHLWSLSLPHPWQFNRDLTQPENAAAFAQMSGYLIRKYWNHPSIILYVTNHNNAGAWGDQNPLRLGGEYKRANSPEEVKIKEAGRANFFVAQKAIAGIDPSRPTYSHASGSIGGQYSLNCYLNWAPKQERDDWLESYFKNGKYPLSFVEWGLPHIASFSSYRGPGFIWSSKGKMTSWDAEYTAAEYGDSTAKWTPEREAVLNRLIREGNKDFNWGRVSGMVGRLESVVRLKGDYFASNLPHMRAWNLGFILPWDDYAFYISKPGPRSAPENPNRWNNLNKPGIVPDFYNWGDYVLTAHKDAFALSSLGEALKRWNQPLIAWIGGEKIFTTKEHNYTPGSTIEKQLVILNDTRVPVSCDYTVWLRKINAPCVRGTVTVQPGSRAFVPFKTVLPGNLNAGTCELAAEFRFSGENVKSNFDFSLTLNVIRPADSVRRAVALYDPKGLTEKQFIRWKIPFRKITRTEDWSKFKTVVIGREALDANGSLPNLDAVRNGLNVLILEQPTRTIERLGFRMNEYGLRKLFVRSSGHPVLNGLPEGTLRDWRGEGTLLPPYLDYDQFFCPPWTWSGFKNHRVWRAGNRGTVANVQIEKPSVGNFTPIADGGFALQYAPLLEYREGKGHILFCQTEVTGRSANEPAAERLMKNMLAWIESVKPPVYRTWSAVGGTAWKTMLTTSLRLENEVGETRSADVILVGPGASEYPYLKPLVETGKTLLAFGLSPEEIGRILPGVKAELRKNAPSMLADLNSSEFNGINNMDTYFQSRLTYSTVNGQEIARLKIGKGVAILVGVTPDMLSYRDMFRHRSSWRRRMFLVSQLIRNAGIGSSSVLLERFRSAPAGKPWLNSYYLQNPVNEDDPYRYYHW